MSYINKLKLNSKKYLLFFAFTIALTACKNDDNDNPEPSVESVTINGTSYPTVKIGRQQWISVNYSGAGGVYYDGDNDVKYGKLYTRKEVQAIKLQDGWRLPTKADFIKLVLNFPHIEGDVNLKPEGVLKLMSTSGWRDINGDNSSGFNALPAGICEVEADGDDDFNFRGTGTQFISSTTEMVTEEGINRSKTATFYMQAESTAEGGVVDIYDADSYRFSVRFVKDIN